MLTAAAARPSHDVVKASSPDRDIDVTTDQRDARTRPVVTSLATLGGAAGIVGLGAASLGVVSAANRLGWAGTAFAIAGVALAGSAAAYLGAAHLSNRQ